MSGPGRSRGRGLQPGEFGWYAVFSERLGQGGEAKVVRLASWPEDSWLRALARGAGSELTFLVEDGDGVEMRWFSGEREVPLCGHGALAAASLLSERLEREGEVEVRNLGGRMRLIGGEGEPRILLRRQPLAPVSAEGFEAEVRIAEAHDAGRDWLLTVGSERELAAFRPERCRWLWQTEKLGCILACPRSGGAAFRFFAPRAGLLEDRASGSAAPALVERWRNPAGRYEFEQASPSGALIRAREVAGGIAVGGRVRELGRGALHLSTRPPEAAGQPKPAFQTT